LRGTNAEMLNNQTSLADWSAGAFGDVTPDSALVIGGQPGFSVAGVPIARTHWKSSKGIDFAVSRNLTMGVSRRPGLKPGAERPWYQGVTALEI
jgi:uncharacterized protein with beta-barrel porin domain